MPLALLRSSSWPQRRLGGRAGLAALLGGLTLALVPTGTAQGAPKLRMAADQRGDFLLIGNTLGHECGNAGVTPVVGEVDCSGSGDSAPDIHWLADDPDPGTARGSEAITPAEQRTTAVLTLPPGATVTHARLYWAARLDTDKADLSTTLARPGVFTQEITADDATTTFHNASSGVTERFYQSTADVTTLVKAQGSGAYRLSGVDSESFTGKVEDRLFAAWSMVVFYELPSEKPRHLMMFDGLDKVGLVPQSIKLSGFTVPGAAIDGKLGVIAYEGDVASSGGQNDYLRFGAGPLGDTDTLSDPVNPAGNFFNGSRGWLGMPQSIAGDLPQLKGTPGSMSGVDLDVVDISSRVKAGQKSADVQAGNVDGFNDIFFLGGFVASIATLLPDFSTSTKSVDDVDGGKVVVGDELAYTIVVTNTGNDTSTNTVLTDPLPPGVSFVPGSLTIVAGPNAGSKTDGPNDDQGEYDPNTRTVTVRIGAGATQTKGGELAVGESSTVRFRVKVEPDAPASIQNQANISAEGKQGAPVENYPTDGNGVDPGSPPTTVPVEECQSNADCGKGPTPVCDTGPDPNVCVGCLNDTQCPGEKPTCDQAQKLCVCVASGAETCDGKDNNCDGKVDEGCLDSDGDGLSNDQEVVLGTDPNDADTDDDGVPDGQEPDPGGDADGDGNINAKDPDSDDDGIFDGTEMGKGCSGPGTDPNSTTCVPDADAGKTTTDPLSKDTDKGGIPDGVEDKNHDGAVQPGEGDPNHPGDDTTGAGGGGGAGGAAGSGGAGGMTGAGGAGGASPPEETVYVSGSGLFGACAAGTGAQSAGGALGLLGLLGLGALVRRRRR